MYRQITDEKDIKEFTGIVRLLVDFDEKTGRWERYRDPETHCIRKAFAVAGENAKRSIYLKDIGGFVYEALVELDSVLNTQAKTVWVHEDGIRQERDDNDKSHPVHSITCVTDLYERAVEVDEKTVIEKFNLVAIV